MERRSFLKLLGLGAAATAIVAALPAPAEAAPAIPADKALDAVSTPPVEGEFAQYWRRRRRRWRRRVWRRRYWRRRYW
ncbi:MAG: twin-arginine translocation signal domain-containing protein [Beijerinckiaceae bacterium]